MHFLRCFVGSTRLLKLRFWGNHEDTKTPCALFITSEPDIEVFFPSYGFTENPPLCLGVVCKQAVVLVYQEK